MYTRYSSAKNCNANGFFVAVSAYLLAGKARSLSVSGESCWLRSWRNLLRDRALLFTEVEKCRNR